MAASAAHSNPNWGDVPAWVTAAIALAAAGFAAWQTLAAQADRHERQRPHVSVDIEPYGHHHGIVRLVVTNLGSTTARDVSLTFDPPLKEGSGDHTASWEYVRRFTGRTWAFIPPGKVYDTVFVFLPDYPASSPRAWNVTVRCSDSNGHPQTAETLRIDLDDIASRSTVTTRSTHDVAETLRNIQSWAEKLPITREGVRVVVEPVSDLRRRHAEERECLEAERRLIRRQQQQ
jgi:hypothetical protein